VAGFPHRNARVDSDAPENEITPVKTVSRHESVAGRVVAYIQAKFLVYACDQRNDALPSDLRARIDERLPPKART
jgi:hypothetical protein